jgi:hypothetical protein
MKLVTKLPLKEQILFAGKVRKAVQDAAGAAMYTRNTLKDLRQVFPIPTFKELRAQIAIDEVKKTGQALHKAMLQKLTKPDIKTKFYYEPGCFAAGTLVHTKEGLVGSQFDSCSFS